MSQPMNLEAIRNAISSRELEYGAMLSGAPAGLMIVLYGQEAAPANLSARQAKAQGWLTSGTYGPHGSTSSASAALRSSLESRLRHRMGLRGSILFRLTWKDRVTPSQRTISALRASPWAGSKAKPGNGYEGPFVIAAIAGPEECYAILPASLVQTLAKAATISGSGCTSLGHWMTPKAHDGEFSTPRTSGRPMHRSTHLQTQVKALLTDADSTLGSWPTCNTTNNGQGEEPGAKAARGMNPGLNPADAARLAGWTTASASDGGRIRDGKISTDTLDVTAQLGSWNSAAASDGNGGKRPHKDTSMTGRHPTGRKVNMGLASQAHIVFLNTAPLRLTTSGTLLTGSSAGMDAGGQLNPAHSRWLMRLPPAWDACAPTATGSTGKRRKPS